MQHLLEVPHCLTRVAECLHTLLVRSQPRYFFCPLQLHFRCALPLPCWLCTFRSSRLEMTENHFWVSAHPPHPIKPNEFVQMFKKEQRQPGVWGTGAPPLLLGVSHAALQMWPQQRCSLRQLPRCLSPKGCLQMSAPSAAARDGVLHLTMMATTRAPAPEANGPVHLGFRAALSHRHHGMTGCRRHRQQACHQAFSRPQSLMLTVRSLASALSTAHCGFALMTLLLAIATTTGTGWMLGAPNSPARQAVPTTSSRAWNPGPARGSDQNLLVWHLNNPWHVIWLRLR